MFGVILTSVLALSDYSAKKLVVDGLEVNCFQAETLEIELNSSFIASSNEHLGEVEIVTTQGSTRFAFGMARMIGGQEAERLFSEITKLIRKGGKICLHGLPLLEDPAEKYYRWEIVESRNGRVDRY